MHLFFIKICNENLRKVVSYTGGERTEKMKNTRREFERMYQKYARQIYRYILKLCKDPVEAEDILQITFLKAIEKSDSFDEKCKLTTWLCRIAHNAWLDERKRRDNRNMSLCGMEYMVPETDDFTEQILDAEIAAHLQRLLDQLKEPYREVLLLRIYGEMSYREIGDAFGKSENWARVTYYRGKEQMRSLWKGDG